MDIHDGLEVLVRHLAQRSWTNIARVVDEDVDAAVVIERRLNDRPAALRGRYRLGASDCFASRSLDLLHHFLCGPHIDAVALQADTRIVDDDPCPLGRKEQRIGAPEPSASACDDGYTAVESEF